MRFRGRKVFVTGATGFIGGRLVEELCLEEGADVTAFVRQSRKATGLAQYPVKVAVGDVLDAQSVVYAMAGCDLAVHCAVDGSGTAEQNRLVTVEGIRNICLAAQTNKIKRLVHLSTISVYGPTPAGIVDESTRKNPAGDPYGESKLEGENLALEFAKSGLPVTILQPTVVYGPARTHWTTSVAEQLAAGTVALPEQGEGICNAVYVDDVVEAIFCALSAEQSRPGPYLISAAQPVTWGDYYRAYSQWIPGSHIKGESTAAIKKRLVRRKVLRLAAKFLPGRLRSKIMGNSDRSNLQPDPNRVVYPQAGNVDFMALRSPVSIRRAQTDLGFNPQFDLERAMKIIGPWLQKEGLAPR